LHASKMRMRRSGHNGEPSREGHGTHEESCPVSFTPTRATMTRIEIVLAPGTPAA
jgi:hypothetical protein